MPKIKDNSTRRVAVNVNLTVGMLEHLDALAESQGMSRSAFIRQAIEQTMQDVEDGMISLARLQDENDPLVPWEQVKREAGL